jgi:hypothetical protein
VEPIKLATEEQTTRSEAAVARLDYFVARAKTTPQIIIPLAELRSIKQDAPPAAVRQPAARALIRRSLLVGYGKPVGAASAAALASVIIVVAFATERGWRVNDERNHWNEGARDRQPVEANLTDLHARPGRRSAVVMDRFSRLSERVSIWDADSGELVDVQTGRLRIVDGWLWHQDRSLNHLSRRDIAGSEVSRITLSADGRPAALNQIQFSMLTEDLSISDEQYVNIEGSFGHLATFDYKNNKWYTKAQSDFKPEGEEGSSWRSRSGKRLFALIVENSKTRLTIFNRNTYETLISEDTSDKLHLVGITDLPNRTIISLIKNGKLELISIPIKEILNQTIAGIERRSINLPNDFQFVSEGSQRWGGPTILSLERRIVIVDRRPLRTIFWALDPELGQFEIMIAAQAAALSNLQGYVWVPEGVADSVMVWLAKRPEPFRIDGIRIRSTDELQLSKDERRLIVASETGAELWSVDPVDAKASLLRRVPMASGARATFSSDEKMITVRQPGGFFFGMVPGWAGPRQAGRNRRHGAGRHLSSRMQPDPALDRRRSADRSAPRVQYTALGVLAGTGLREWNARSADDRSAPRSFYQMSRTYQGCRTYKWRACR